MLPREFSVSVFWFFFFLIQSASLCALVGGIELINIQKYYERCVFTPVILLILCFHNLLNYYFNILFVPVASWVYLCLFSVLRIPFLPFVGLA